MANSPEARPRILVVDDDADTRLLLRMMLAGGGFEVLLAADGEQAWGILSETVPDVVLSDLMMPKLDGLGLLQRIRANPALRALPVILLTAQAGRNTLVEARVLGADDFLTKPLQKAELLALVSAKIPSARPAPGSPPPKGRDEVLGRIAAGRTPSRSRAG